MSKAEEVARRFDVYAAEHDLRLSAARRSRLNSRARSAASAGYAAGARVNLGSAARIASGVRMIAR